MNGHILWAMIDFFLVFTNVLGAKFSREDGNDKLANFQWFLAGTVFMGGIVQLAQACGRLGG